jgi:hypothetical protein
VKGLNKSISFNDPYEFGEALPDKDVNSAFAQWQISHHKKCPIILLTLAIAGLPCATPGFPGRLLLAPFLCQLRQLSKAIYKEIPGESRDISKDKPVLPSIMRPIINNIKENFGPIKLCQYGVSQWGYKEDESTKAFITWLNKFPDKEKLIPQTILVSPKTGVVSPYTKHLLQDFKPLKWARPFCGIKSDIFPAETFPYKSAGGSESHPAWLLKTNVILLDMLIQKLLVALCKRILHKGLKDDKSDEIGPRDIDRLIFKFKHFIIKAMEEGISDSSKGIVDGSEEETTDGAEGIADDSKKETPNGSELFSELDKILFEKLVNQYMQLKEDKLVKENKLVEDVRKGMSQLALFLKLRVLFYAAYLLIIPDTSDIVKAWDSVGRWEFVLPMI